MTSRVGKAANLNLKSEGGDGAKAKKKRKRRHSEESEGYGGEEVLPRWKIVMVFAAIGICFAMLFPSLFGPLFGSWFGRKEQPQANNFRATDHPSMRGMGPGDRPRPPRPPMPGGGRMAGFENQPQQTSSKGGMFSWLMPFYTVGVMGFLIYSLFKMKTKKKKRRRRHYDDESDYSDDSEDTDNGTGLGRRNLRSIQSRLQETELAMAKILEQLEEIAQAHPEASTTEDLKDQFTPEQIAEVESSLTELNRLSDLCKRQRRQLNSKSSDESEGLEEEEEGFDLDAELRASKDSGVESMKGGRAKAEAEERAADVTERRGPKRQHEQDDDDLTDEVINQKYVSEEKEEQKEQEDAGTGEEATPSEVADEQPTTSGETDEQTAPNQVIGQLPTASEESRHSPEKVDDGQQEDVQAADDQLPETSAGPKQLEDGPEDRPPMRLFESSTTICREAVLAGSAVDDRPLPTQRKPLEGSANELARTAESTWSAEKAAPEGRETSESSASSGGKGRRRRGNRNKTNNNQSGGNNNNSNNNNRNDNVNDNNSKNNDNSRSNANINDNSRSNAKVNDNSRSNANVNDNTLSPSSNQPQREPSECADVAPPPAADLGAANPLFELRAPAEGGAGVRRRKPAGVKKSNVRRRVPKAE